MLLVLVCMVFHRGLDSLTLDNSTNLCSLLPNHNHILHPDQQHHCRRSLVAVLKIASIQIDLIKCKAKMMEIKMNKMLPVKQPLMLRAFEFSTGSIALNEHGENLLLFFLSPDVARANMI